MRIQKEIRDVLRRLRLTENEVALYLAGLELGSAKASEIAKKAGVSRPLAYQTISGLEEKGLVSKTGPRYGSMFTMEPPSRLKDLLSREEREIRMTAAKLEDVLPSLESLNPSSSTPSRIRFYNGAEGLENIAQDILKSVTKEMLALVPVENIFELFEKGSVSLWQRERAKLGMRTRSLWSAYDKNLESEDALTERRLIPQTMQPFASTVVIYDTKVAVFSSPEKLFAFVVESDEFSKTMRSVFEQLWSGAEAV